MERSEAFGPELAEAGRALEAFAAGPARAAADEIERAFARAGRVISSEMTSFAKSGEADLDRLARKLVETLAQLAVRSAFGAEGALSPVNLVMHVAPGAQAADVVSSANQIAAAAARAVRRGARFT